MIKIDIEIFSQVFPVVAACLSLYSLEHLNRYSVCMGQEEIHLKENIFNRLELSVETIIM